MALSHSKTQLRVDQAKMKNRTSEILYTYWNEVRGDRIAPRRFEIEPARLASVLPDAFILERIGDLNVRYRLAGTRILDQFGSEFRGLSFFDGYSRDDRILLENHIRNMVQCGGGVLLQLSCQAPSGREAEMECLVLPLIHGRETVDRFVGVISAIDTPDWLGDEPLPRRRITASRTLWSRAAEPAVIPFPLAPPPLEPHLRAARIVRTNSRNFRVYDGGLVQNDGDKS